MKYGFIKYSSINNSGFRLDPSLHLSEGHKVRAELSKFPYGLKSVIDCSDKIFLGNIFSRNFVRSEEFGVPYLAASDTVLSNIDTGKFVSFRQAQNLSYLMLEKDWILVTCSGTLGNVTFTNDSYCGKLATHDLIRIIPNDKKFKKGCLYAFLASKYGYYQITQSQFGGVVKHINDKQTASILVPNFKDSFQDEVDSLIAKAASLRFNASVALKEAINKIEVFANKKQGKTYGPKYNRTNVSSVNNSFKTRLDPTFFIGDGIDWAKSLKCETKKLKDLNLRMWYPGIFKRTYVESGYPYIKGSSLFDVNPFKNCDYLSKTRTPRLEELWLKEGMLLVSCAGLCGQVKLITKEYEDKRAIGSPDIIRLVSNDKLITTEYLFAYMQMPCVFDFIQSLKYGSVIERIDIGNLELLPIVVPSKELCEQVTSIIKTYMDMTYKAFLSEELAVRKIESEITKWN